MSYLCLFKDEIPRHINEIALPEINDIKTLASTIDNIPTQVRNIGLTNVPESKDYQQFFAIISIFSGLSLLRLPQNSSQFYKKNAFFTIHFSGLPERTLAEYKKIAPKYVFIGTGEEIAIYPEFIRDLMRIKISLETSS